MVQMFSRFSNDDSRLQKSAEIASFQERYFLDTPGWGDRPAFSADPQLRAQGWGANLRTNTVNLESDLYGLTRRSCRDHVDKNNYAQHAARSEAVSYPETAPFVEDSRATHPAWMYRALEPDRWERPLLDPFSEKRFADNIQTRILAKDNFRPHVMDFAR